MCEPRYNPSFDWLGSSLRFVSQLFEDEDKEAKEDSDDGKAEAMTVQESVQRDTPFLP